MCVLGTNSYQKKKVIWEHPLPDMTEVFRTYQQGFIQKAIRFVQARRYLLDSNESLLTSCQRE